MMLDSNGMVICVDRSSRGCDVISCRRVGGKSARSLVEDFAHNMDGVAAAREIMPKSACLH